MNEQIEREISEEFLAMLDKEAKFLGISRGALIFRAVSRYFDKRELTPLFAPYPAAPRPDNPYYNPWSPLDRTIT